VAEIFSQALVSVWASTISLESRACWLALPLDWLVSDAFWSTTKRTISQECSL